jgi:TRAP-type uncharacterized transport system fused permease subunit
MTDITDRLTDAMARFDAIHTAPDLLRRIEAAVDADERRRKRLRRWIAVFTTVAVAVIAFVTWTLERGVDMDWWILELVTTAVLFALAFVLGPFIRKYGKSYVADVFAASPGTGKSFVVLTDVAYYLIFSAYILLTTSFQQRTAWGIFGNVTAEQVQDEVARIGGILLIIGVLHAINLVVLPIVGRLLAPYRSR